MRTYLVTFDLRSSPDKRLPLTKQLNHLRFSPLQSSVWAGSSADEPATLKRRLEPHINRSDSLFIVDITGCDCEYHNLL